MSDQPAHAEHTHRSVRGYPCCGKCGRTLSHRWAFRCPYVACRCWLIGYDDEQPPKGKRTTKPKETHA